MYCLFAFLHCDLYEIQAYELISVTLTVHTVFTVFAHRDDTPFKGSKASLGSSMKLDTDDEASLLEYGEPDSMKFNEDGSFIGQYQDRNRRYDPSAV